MDKYHLELFYFYLRLSFIEYKIKVYFDRWCSFLKQITIFNFTWAIYNDIVRFNCEFNGHLEIEEEQSICVFPCVTETADATETGIMDNPLFNLADVDVFDKLDWENKRSERLTPNSLIFLNHPVMDYSESTIQIKLEPDLEPRFYLFSAIPKKIWLFWV